MRIKSMVCGILSLVLMLSLFSGTTSANESWVTKTGMTYSTFDFGTALINGKIYAFGGSGGTRRTTEVYDPTSDTWELKASIPYEFARGSSVLIGSKVYFVGNEYTSTLVYDSLADTWETKSSMPSFKFWTSAVAYDGKVYTFGGTTSAGSGGVSPLNTVEMYDPETDTWTSKHPMPTARAGSRSIVFGGKVYVIGGNIGASKTNVVEVYDPVTDTWTTKTSMPTQRSHLTLTLVGNKIYAIGGANTVVNDTNGFTAAVEIYDPQTDTWTSGLSLPQPRGQHETVLVGNNIYVIGGFNGSAINSVLTLGVGAPQEPEEPEQPSQGERALLTIYISGGQIKEYDLSAAQLNSFISWYDAKDAGTGPAKYKFTKTWNKGPFKTRSEYVIFDKILTFDVDEYDVVIP